MKVKYRKNGKRAFRCIKIPKQLIPVKETVTTEITTLPAVPFTPKKKKSFFRTNILFFFLIALLLVITFGTCFSPKMIQQENQAYVASVEKVTKDIVMIPSGRLVFYENAWKFPTVRAVIIDDFSYDLKDGRCISFHKVFTDTKSKECFGTINRTDAEKINNVQEEQ
ncbi:MAG: hypothetical protein NTZ13_03190 [Candidatus Parcubacteria bacterium]|nr:hypothetical protein [Candidatus Parcubacteria bacterium]